MEKLFSVENKNILLTGGGQGIGLALAKGLTRYGGLVGIFDNRMPVDIEDDIHYFPVDLKNDDELSNQFHKFIDRFKSIDVLINCAGVTMPGESKSYSLKDWETTIKINLTAPFCLSAMAAREMCGQKLGGSIINVTSIGGIVGFPGNPAYGASKGGLNQLTKALALDWGPDGVRVNNLVPGYTNTLMNRKSWENNESRAKRANHTILKRWAEPNDFIGPAIFLASDASRYVTGADIVVDGGWLAKGI